jgi:hypothetical protein
MKSAAEAREVYMHKYEQENSDGFYCCGYMLVDCPGYWPYRSLDSKTP